MKATVHGDSATSRLRDATRQQHADLEASIDWDAAFSSLVAYAELLRRIATVQLPADAAIDAHLADGPDWLSTRRTAGWLMRDLRRLADAAGVPGSACDPRPCADLDWVDSPAAAAGLVYVLEGSTMGASVLARLARNRLGLSRGEGCDYLHAYGDDTPTRWRRTKQWLDASLSRDDQVAAAEASARRLFRTYATAVGGRAE